jgi:hypothetical protein
MALPFEEALRYFLTSNSSLSPLLGSNVFSAFSQQRPATPYLVFVQIGPRPLHSHQGPPSPGILQRLYQFSIFDPSQSDSILVADTLRLALDGFSGSMAVSADPSAQQYSVKACLFQSQKYMFDADSRVHMQALDFFIQFI